MIKIEVKGMFPVFLVIDVLVGLIVWLLSTLFTNPSIYFAFGIAYGIFSSLWYSFCDNIEKKSKAEENK